MEKGGKAETEEFPPPDFHPEFEWKEEIPLFLPSALPCPISIVLDPPALTDKKKEPKKCRLCLTKTADKSEEYHWKHWTT